MGIRFFCPNGHKLNVKSELAGKIGICPKCQARMTIPTASVYESSGGGGFAETSLGSAGGASESAEREDFRGDSAIAATSGERWGDGETQNGASERRAQSTTASDEPQGKFFLNGERAEAALGDVLRRAVDASAQNELGAERFDDSDPLRDTRLLWYVRSRDQQYGPATGDVMASWINERRIGPQTLVWREDWPAWREAGLVFSDLERFFSGGDAAVGAGGEASAFASLAEAAQNSGAARRFADDESRAMRRRKRATQTLIAIAGLIALILGLLGALIFVLLRD
ncbi:MAG: DUF4339 domain-containing protein [Thermoguttaceae bacterium]|nr:DUF4339 domain-containing protein [Thermoguttaceae bacterium]